MIHRVYPKIHRSASPDDITMPHRHITRDSRGLQFWINILISYIFILLHLWYTPKIFVLMHNVLSCAKLIFLILTFYWGDIRIVKQMVHFLKDDSKSSTIKAVRKQLWPQIFVSFMLLPLVMFKYNRFIVRTTIYP